MDMAVLLVLLPEALLLSTFPFCFYRIAYGKRVGLNAIACFLAGMLILAYYLLINITSGMSGGGAGTALGTRLLQTGLQVLISLVVFPAAAAGLARAGRGTLG